MNDPVFLSYPRESADMLELLLGLLRKKGIKSTWVDRTKIEVGKSIGEEIKKGVESSRACVFVLNTHTLKSTWCMAEVAAFWGANKPIIIYLTEPRCDVPDFLQGIRYTKDSSQVVDACKAVPPLGQPNSQEHPMLTLFERCGLTSAFRIRTMDHEREIRVEQLVKEECAREKPVFRLLASSGKSYLNSGGKVWLSGLGTAIKSAKAEITAVLASPFSHFAITRALANKVIHDQWDKKGMASDLADLVKLNNVTLKVTGFPVNCSLFFTSKAVFYDPYLWGRPDDATPTENNFWVFEFQNKDSPGYECYRLLEQHFKFLLEQSIPANEILGEQLTTYHALARRFEQRVQEIQNGGKHDFAVCI